MTSALEMRLQKLLDRGIALGETDCASVLVRQHGKELCYVQAGLADRRADAPIARNTIFRMYSESKPVTSAAVMLLMDQGSLDLVQPVRKYLPGFENPMVYENGKLVPAKRDVLVYDLLSMTAGLCYPTELDVPAFEAGKLFAENALRMRKGEGMGTVEFANRMGQLPLAFHPGEHFRYSTCADVAGALVEVISGKRYGDFLREELFQPLGMKDTAFYVPEEKRSRLAASCWIRKGMPNAVWDGEYLCCEACTKDPAFQSGGAGLFSTIDDYAAFAQMLLNRGSYEGKRVLSPRIVEYMTSPQLNEAQLRDFRASWNTQGGFSYGKLMRVCVDPAQASTLARKGEYGWGGWLATEMFNLPNEDASVLYMTSLHNESDNTGLYNRIRNVILSELD